MHHSSTSICLRNCSKLQRRRSEHSRHRRTKDCRTHTKQIRCTGDIKSSDDYPCREMLHCKHRHLIRKRFKASPEEEIQGIEVQEACRPNERSAISNSPPIQYEEFSNYEKEDGLRTEKPRSQREDGGKRAREQKTTSA
ncbi:hypothetical protein TNCV_2859731 [Trichonephila clavipes]|nr:hypothetical protein TNCV_2859731 [Trichonephila clavipes]